MVTLTAKETVVKINMITKIKIAITRTEKKPSNNNNSNNTVTKVIAKTQTISKQETLILKWK